MMVSLLLSLLLPVLPLLGELLFATVLELGVEVADDVVVAFEETALVERLELVGVDFELLCVSEAAN